MWMSFYWMIWNEWKSAWAKTEGNEDGTSRYEIENNKLYVNGESVHHYPLDVAGHLVTTGGKESGN